jgi:hypothetical protein
MTEPSGPSLAPSDDPTGGRELTRRLKVAVPVALVVGLAIGVPVAIIASDWRPAVAIPLGLGAIVGTLIAAIEDGRVQRRVSAATGASTQEGLRAARQAAHAGDILRARAEVQRALLRGANPARVEGALEHPDFTEDAVARLAQDLGEPFSPPPAPPASR